MNNITAELTNILASLDRGDSLAITRRRIDALRKIVIPTDSITTAYYYLPGSCELAIRLRAASLHPSRNSVLLAMEALEHKTDSEKLEALVRMEF